MPSRLEQLSDFVMLISIKENQSKWLDVLAVVEAARHLRDNCDVYGGNPHIVIPAAVALDKALAKLDEVQP
jgi:hypothetical protein